MKPTKRMLRKTFKSEYERGLMEGRRQGIEEIKEQMRDLIGVNDNCLHF